MGEIELRKLEMLPGGFVPESINGIVVERLRLSAGA